MRKIITALIFCFAALSAEQWESTQLVWNFGIAAACDRGLPEDPKLYFQKQPRLSAVSYLDMKEGEIAWVQPHLLFDFYRFALPLIKAPFVLVISDGDASFPSECLPPDEFQDLLSNPHLLHIFAQNCDAAASSEKITPIPIGIDFHTVCYKGSSGGWGMFGSPREQEKKLLRCLFRAPPTSQRKCRAFVDFQHSDTLHGDFMRYLQLGEDRTSIFRKIAQSQVVDSGPWMKREELWKKKSEYAFSISPHGNGLDCHRTWEDLALGCIVIVKTSPLDSLYEGLPVAIVKDWDEINEENFQKWKTQFGDASHNPAYREKLTNRHWIEQIKKAAQEFHASH